MNPRSTVTAIAGAAALIACAWWIAQAGISVSFARVVKGGEFADYGGAAGTVLAQARDKAPPDIEATLKSSFESSLKRVEERRKRDRSTTIDVTDLFAEFYRHKQLSAYTDFFQSIRISTKAADHPPRHFVYAELDREQLKFLGFGGFSRGDKLVIVFATDSATSGQITSFKVTLLNPQT